MQKLNGLKEVLQNAEQYRRLVQNVRKHNTSSVIFLSHSPVITIQIFFDSINKNGYHLEIVTQGDSTMEIASTASASYSPINLNPLKAANEQPKLALQLILATVDANSIQNTTASAQSPAAVSGKGQYINITA